MSKRREIVEITRLVFIFLKKNERAEFSINQIAKKIETRWDTTERALELLRFLALVKARVDGSGKNATRYYSLKTRA